MNNLNFIAESLKHLKTVGTVFPCSPACAHKLIKPVNFQTASVLVELGGGNGAITKEILPRMRSDARLIVFEVNPDFAQSLRELGDPRLTVVQDSAEKIEDYLKREQIDTVDAVISTLPFVLMEEAVRNRIMDSVMRVVKQGGCFTQIQYSLMTAKEMKSRFKNLRIDFTLFNAPPAFFYIVTKEPAVA